MKPTEKSLNKLTSLSSASYDERIISMFKGCKQDDMPPHIYSYTQTIYKNMLSTRRDQSIILMGHSGSGKTQNSKHILHYLFKVATPAINPTNFLSSTKLPLFNEIKLTAMYSILNAFCSIQTDRNVESNRFLNVFLLEFNHAGQLASILLQLIVFDHTRLVYQPNTDESNYLIFYYMLYGADSETLTYEYQIDSISDLIETNENSFFQSENVQKMKQQAGTEFNLYKIKFKQIMDSFKILNFTNEEVKALLSILAAIVHLGRAGACSLNSTSNHQKVFGQFQSANEAHKAANLLGITFSQLNEHVFTLSTHSNLSSSTNSNLRSKYGNLSGNGSSRVSPADASSMHITQSPIECLQGFCIGLYQECLNLISNYINRSFKATHVNPNIYYNNQSVSNSMLLIDPPGFHYQKNNSKHLASYSDLLCNYLSERLQLMFFQINFINPIEKCAQEGLDIDLVEHIPESPSGLVNWFDRPLASNSIIQRGSATSEQNNGINNMCGLLWLIEEQMYAEQKSSKLFMRKLIESDPKQNFISTINNSSSNNFTIYHQYGQFPVEYNVDTWLENFNKEFLTQRNALPILQDSKKDSIKNSFLNSAAMSSAAAAISHHGVTINSSSPFFLSSSNLDSSNINSVSNATSSLKRQASVRKMLTLSKRKTFTINFKLQIDSIFDSLRRTKCNFVFCFLPQQNTTGENSNNLLSSVSQQQENLDVPLVRNQLKAYQILAASRIYRQGKNYFLKLNGFGFLKLNIFTIIVKRLSRVHEF
jgi:myosin XVIII